MRRTTWNRLTAAVAIVLTGTTTHAELQNVETDGYLRIRSRDFHNVFAQPQGPPGEIRIPSGYLAGRPIGPWGAASRYAFDDKSSELDYMEQQVRLGFRADFTHDVAAYIQFNHLAVWGKGEFRSDYMTGFDFYGPPNRGVQVNQAYIDLENVYGLPLDLRIGRQSIVLGSGWLISSYSGLTDRSFDGVRATWKTEDWSLDAIVANIGERSPTEKDEDVTLVAFDGTWTVNDHLALSPYWYWIRDPRSLNDTNFSAPVERLEDIVGLDDYDPTNIHTVGARLSGAFGAFDYETEAAYQFGEAGSLGQLFSAFGTYGDDAAEYDAWGMDATIGYTFDAKFSPRVYGNFVYMSGEDNRDISFREWLSPFDDPSRASLSFNRLFSGTTYLFVWDRNKNLSNFRRLALGLEANVTDSVSFDVNVGKYWVNDTFDGPRSVRLGGYNVPIAPALSFWTQPSSDDMGWGVDVNVRYEYSDDLLFRLIYQYVLPGDAISDGNFQDRNGLEFLGGSDDDDASYLSFDMSIKF